ncbi:DNA replication ATP-dependent helicase/nuclease DNA2 [Drosophila obscura]|uniref:DNA replication ATP-dependent helicase/nuclease DNA2 n=1 Tax=Drosophila obscura TaxID=7282 RepID=UPI000B9F99E8|nr:DNA replication ATP-dependent helicase/nuclease DNA2 [Drosophila obscura]
MAAPGPKRVLTPSKENGSVSPVQQPVKKAKTNLDAALTEDMENYSWNEEFDIDEIDLEAAMDAAASPHQLNLTTWQRCIIEEFEMDLKTLHVKMVVRKSPSQTRETAECLVLPPWSVCNMKQGDLVSLLAKWQPSQNVYVVDKEHGFCVTNPDFLVSGTTVVGSLFCRRKTVLQERFRGLQWNNRVMILGTLVHELFQRVVSGRDYTRSHVQTILKYMLQSPYLAQFLYAGGITENEIFEDMQRFVDPIVRFTKQYVLGEKPAVPTPANFRGRIQQIEITEENLWVPQLGLKGKVDVSVSVTTANDPIPLELKTGRSTFSLEHTGQLMLYQMMHSALGVETRSGLLLYLRENMMREVVGKRNEMRDLIMMRNDLAKYLVKEVKTPASAEEDIEDLYLPEPIHHHSACQTCQYKTLCGSYAKRDTKLNMGPRHSMAIMLPDILDHLTDEDQEFFHHWCGILALEDKHSRASYKQPTIWTEDPVARQQQGRAIIQLRLYPGQLALKTDGRFEQNMELPRHADPSINLHLCGFDVGEYVVVSTASRMAVAAGNIVSLECRRLSIALDRDLKPQYEDETFIVDKHDSQTFSTFNYTNLAMLLSSTLRAQQLRSIIVGMAMPVPADSLPDTLLTEGLHILMSLNKQQNEAIMRCLSSNTHFLIKGLPGTGKTQTLVALVRLLHLLGLSVLITAHTHSAVDNLMRRLMGYGLPMVRLGQSSRIAHHLEEISEANITRRCRTVEQLSAALETPSIVGVTCLGMGHPVFRNRHFDFCIVDEATQVLLPTILRPLFYSQRFVLVGDPDQLPPVVKSREARKRGADESLFERLDSPDCTAELSVQYRMNSTINRLANRLTYDDHLRCANESVANAHLQLNSMRNSPVWVQRVLQTHLDNAVVVVDTGDCSLQCQAVSKGLQWLGKADSNIDLKYGEQDPEVEHSDVAQRVDGRRISQYTNTCEVGVVMNLLLQLQMAEYDLSTVGVIAPYRAQVELLRRLGERLDGRVEFNTVDQYQGRDKNIIIYSCTKTGRDPLEKKRCRAAEILEDRRRLTVAITRAKQKLIILGDVACLKKYNPFDSLFRNIPEKCVLPLIEGRLEFAWKCLHTDLNRLIDPMVL